MQPWSNKAPSNYAVTVNLISRIERASVLPGLFASCPSEQNA